MERRPAPDDPLVSVIIPAYERSYILSESIDSVLEQTLPDLEVIVVNDGSTDDTEAVVTGYEDPRVRYFSHEVNKGVSAARNTGIEQANGKYLAFLDADDEWLPEKLEYQIRELERTDAGIVYSNHFVLHDGSVSHVKTPDIENPNRHYIDVFNAHVLPLMSTILARRDCIGTTRFNESLQGPEDLHFMIRIFKECKPAKVKKPLAYYRYTSDSLSHSDAARFHRNHTLAIDDLVDQLPELEQYYEKKRAMDLWKAAFMFAKEDQFEETRRLARQSIAISPNQLAVLPAYGLLLVSFLPVAAGRRRLLRLAERTYQRLMHSVL